MTARQRKALLDKPVAIVNYRVCHALKRWGGVFVNDYFGEGITGIGLKKRLRRENAQEVNTSPSFENGVTKFEDSISADDYAAWERLADNDENV